MKYTPFAVFGLGMLAVFGTLTANYGETTNALPSQADSAKDRAKWRLATISAAREILDELNHPQPLGSDDRAVLVDKLNNAMQKDLQAHASRSASQNLCAEIAIKMRRENLERRFKEVTAHANEQSLLSVTWADVESHLGGGWSNTVEQAMQSFANTELAPLFKDSRARAVGLLRQELEQQFRFPTENEVNGMLGELVARHSNSPALTANDEAVLQQQIMDLANPEHKVYFEELAQVLREPTLRISGETRKQYERQLSLLDTAASQRVPNDRRQASTIGTALVKAIENDLEIERAKPPITDVGGKIIPVYPLLAPVLSFVPVIATKLESERLITFLAQCPVLALQSDSLAKVIRAAPEKHHTLALSENEFMTSLQPDLLAKATTAYAAEANPVGETHYFETLLTTNPALTTAFKARVSIELHAQLPEARRAVSEEQFNKAFSSLERQVVLSSEALALLQDSGGAALTSLSEAAKLFGISVRNNNSLLEETVNRVLTLSNQKAREGYDVLTSQLTLVRKLEQDRLAKLRDDVAARRPYKAIRAEWQAALEAAWSADSRSQSTPYKEILDLTLASLNKAVRQLYDSVQESPTTATAATPSEARPTTETEQGKVKELLQVPAKPEDQNPEPQKEVKPPAPKTSDKGAGSEGAADVVLSRTRVDRRNEPDGILLLTGAATGPATARLLNQAGMAIFSISFDPGKPQEAATVIFEAMKPQLKTIWANTVLEWQKEHSGLGILKRRTPPKLKLFIVIESEDVRHRMSLLLRQHIDELLTEWDKAAEKGTPAVELDWKVGLTFEQITQGP